MPKPNNKREAQRDPGNGWKGNRFGPPPGIPRREKERLANLPDKEYVNAVLSKPIDEIKSLMVSEAERRRSFRSTWTFEDTVKGVELAKAGFYFLNSEDRVKCAFCSGVVRQWNKGDRPMIRHNQHFSFCKFVQGKSRFNIPYSNVQDASNQPNDIEPKLSTQPDRPKYHMPKLREQTFSQTWPAELRQLIPKICDAGFFLVGPGDRCACFFCGGTLEDWTSNDDPWAEHAKWYFKCPYLIQCKGGDYIQKIRATMTEQDRHESENLKYNISNLNPEKTENETDSLKKRKVREYFSYKFVFKTLNYSDDTIIQAHRENDWNEYENPHELLQRIHKIEDKEIDPRVDRNDPRERFDEQDKPIMEKDVKESLMNGNELTESQKYMLYKKLCRYCHQGIIEVILLPCACYQICIRCWMNNEQPDVCKECSTRVEEAIPLELLRNEKEIIKVITSGEKLTDSMKKVLSKETTCQDCGKISGGVLLPCRCFQLCIACSKENMPEQCKICSTDVGGYLTLAMLRMNGKLRHHVVSKDIFPNSLLQDLQKELTCRICLQEQCGAIFLPCGCRALCGTCRNKKLPYHCPACFNTVKGTEKADLTKLVLSN